MTATAKYVLLMEDDTDIVEALDLLFGSEGIPWRRADHPIDRADPPALALLDLSMAESVEEQLTTLRALGVPIVVASASPDARERAAALGAVECLEKPFDLHVLLDLVRRAAPGLGLGSR
jgi:DNA-binding response OmpR family regulator